MMVSLLLSRVLGIVRDIVIAWKFGQNQFTDAYILAFQIPDLLFYLVAGGALSSAFIPVFSEYWHTGRREEAWKVFSVVTTVLSLVIAVFIVAAAMTSVQLAHLVAPGKPELAELIASMSRILLPAQFAFFIGGLMMGTLYARQVFSVPGLGPNVYNLGIIMGALVISQFVSPGVAGMAWGALVGAIVGNLIIPIVAMTRLGSQFRISFDLSHPGVKKVFALMAPVVLGLSLPGVFSMITRGFSSLYRIEGLNTAMETANRLMQAPLGIFGQSLALAAFPALAQFYAQQRMDQYRGQLAATLNVIVYLSVPVSALLIALPEPIVRAAFEHGQFTARNTEMTAACLRMFAIGIVAWCVHPVAMRAFFAVQRSWPPILMGTATTGLFIGLSYAVLSGGLGYPMLALAGSIAAFALAAMLLAGISRAAGGLELGGLMATLGKSVAAAGLAVGPAALLVPWLLTLGKGASIAATFGLCLACAWAYYFVTRAMKMEQTATVDRALARLGGRQRSPGPPPPPTHPPASAGPAD